MPRVSRGLADNQVYHILNRGNGRQDVFHKPEDFAAFVRLIGEAKQKYPVKMIAYCLMTNHFHLVVKVEQGGDLSKWMQWLMTSHVRRYHRHYESSGHVWQGRFKSFIVQDDDHLLSVVRYVEGNPVRAGMVASAQDWPWSSHRENLGTGSFSPLGHEKVPVPFGEKIAAAGQGPAVVGTGEVSAFVDTTGHVGAVGHASALVDTMGQAPFMDQMVPVPVVDVGMISLPSDWTHFVDMPITASELNKLSKSLKRQAPFGSEKWQEQICQQLGLESTMRQRGRPRIGTDL